MDLNADTTKPARLQEVIMEEYQFSELKERDLETVREIYNYYVLNSTAVPTRNLMSL